MNSNYSTYNTIRQHFRNAISSKLFLAVTICATVFTSFITASFILEMIEAGFYGHAPSILNIVFPILSIVGTVGLYCTRSAVRNDDICLHNNSWNNITHNMYSRQCISAWHFKSNQVRSKFRNDSNEKAIDFLLQYCFRLYPRRYNRTRRPNL